MQSLALKCNEVFRLRDKYYVEHDSYLHHVYLGSSAGVVGVAVGRVVFAAVGAAAASASAAVVRAAAAGC